MSRLPTLPATFTQAEFDHATALRQAVENAEALKLDAPALRELFRRLGVTGRVRADDSKPGVVRGAGAQPLLVCDEFSFHPEDHARALARLVAAAINAVVADAPEGP